MLGKYKIMTDVDFYEMDIFDTHYSILMHGDNEMINAICASYV